MYIPIHNIYIYYKSIEWLTQHGLILLCLNCQFGKMNADEKWFQMEMLTLYIYSNSVYLVYFAMYSNKKRFPYGKHRKNKKKIKRAQKNMVY